MLLSVSRKTSSPQILPMMSVRVISCPLRSTSRSRIHGDSLQLQSTASTAQFIGAPVQFKIVSESQHVRGHIAPLTEVDDILP
jgi:hypothetical protein